MHQIGNAIPETDQITQEDAASSEETASVAQELTRNAQEMSDTLLLHEETIGTRVGIEAENA